jgi:hypothetical protein
MHVIPEKARIQKISDWILPYQVRGRLSQARNDNKAETFLEGNIFTAVSINQAPSSQILRLIPFL